MIRSADRSRRGRFGPVPLMLIAAAVVTGSAMLPLDPQPVRGESTPDHLVISELVTGGDSASDELIELYNPTGDVLPLEGLELVYVTASGATVSRRAAWEAGTPELGPGRHLLVANEAGLYAGIADATYSSGIAATGGSVALRIQGASSAIDALGWGTAASTWLEGTPAPAPASGASLERLPGGAFGSTHDTDDNAGDFVERLVPDPQNSGSPPTPDPDNPPSSPTPDPSPTASSVPTPAPSSSPAPSSTPDPAVSVATARAVPDGTTVTVEATALTGSAFSEGGGYVADSSAGIAVLLTSGSFERGARLRITGTVDDRFAQRTLRSDAAGLTILGSGTEPEPVASATGAVGEALEGRLVRMAGAVGGPPSQLSAGLAYDVDDGSGPVRVVVATATGIDTSGWSTGSFVDVVGVVGQRDSTGTGASGYRVQPRDEGDVLSTAGPSPSASASPPSQTGSPSPSAAPPADGLVTIAEARSMAKNTRTRIRGTVTMAPGVIDPVSAVVQDATGAILLRVADEVGPLSRGDRVEVTGTRSTLAGMETLRVTAPAVRAGSSAEPDPATLRSGDAGEAHEALLVRVRGAVVASARRVASGTVSFEIDDGSGPLRIFLAAPLGAEAATFPAGAWVEAVGVLGQETTGAQPLRGYRLWPRSAGEVRVAAAPSAVAGGPSAKEGETGGSTGETVGGDGDPVPSASLEQIGSADLAGLHVAATVVLGPWPELDLGGLLWDGDRLVVVDRSSTARVRSLIGELRPPLPVQLTGLHALGTHDRVGVPVVRLGRAATDAVRRDGPPDPPRATLPEAGAAWVSLVGRLSAGADRRLLEVDGERIAVELHCDDAADDVPAGVVMVSGIGLADPSRLLVPCDGVRPAPGIERASADLAGMPATASPDGGRSSPSAAPPEPSGRLLAAGLLAAGALLVAAAAAVRRLHPEPPSDLPSGKAEPADGAEPDEAPAGAPPALTLVSVPHERGSP